MQRYYSPVLAIACLVACGQPDRDTAGKQPGALIEARHEPSGASSPSFKAGQNLRVLKTAPCRETGRTASHEPWSMKPGAFVTFIRVEGSEVRVETGPGMECVMAPGALGPA